MFDPARIRKVAINTGGGDAPGLNAVVRAATLAGIAHGWDMWGIKYGYRGLLDPREMMRLTADNVRGITHQGGSILGTANKGNPFEYPVVGPDGKTTLVDRSDEVVTSFQEHGFDALICIGGDGSLRIAHRFIQKGMPIVGVPKTIDNDLSGTVMTFGFDTAVATATDAIDKLHSTAESHERVMVVELMGRYAGWIALNAGLSGGADVILIPNPLRHREGVRQDPPARGDRAALLHRGGGRGRAAHRRRDGDPGAEGGRPRGAAGRHRAAGGRRDRPPHRQGDAQPGAGPPAARRGSPTSFDGARPALRRRRGARAGRGKMNVMVALNPPHVDTIPIGQVIERMKVVGTRTRC